MSSANSPLTEAAEDPDTVPGKLEAKVGADCPGTDQYSEDVEEAGDGMSADSVRPAELANSDDPVGPLDLDALPGITQ